MVCAATDVTVYTLQRFVCCKCLELPAMLGHIITVLLAHFFASTHSETEANHLRGNNGILECCCEQVGYLRLHSFSLSVRGTGEKGRTPTSARPRATTWGSRDEHRNCWLGCARLLKDTQGTMSLSTASQGAKPALHCHRKLQRARHKHREQGACKWRQPGRSRRDPHLRGL